MAEKVIIFGVGMKLAELRVRGALSDMEVIAYSDNDRKTWGTEIDGRPVIKPTDIVNYDYDAVYISTEQYFYEIKQQLIDECNIQQDKIKDFTVSKDKYEGEIAFWKALYQKLGNKFDNSGYEELMLTIAGEPDDSFWKDKVVVDFGCGPQGSLTWTKTPAVRIGVDVLADRYLWTFGEELIKHDMVYVTSSEKKIPIPDEFADYLITTNSLDHVDCLDDIVSELLRILKTNGVLLASFNINELSTECEPQTLTEKKLQDKLLKYFEIDSYKLKKTGKVNSEGEEQAVLYVRATKDDIIRRGVW